MLFLSLILFLTLIKIHVSVISNNLNLLSLDLEVGPVQGKGMLNLKTLKSGGLQVEVNLPMPANIPH